MHKRKASRERLYRCLYPAVSDDRGIDRASVRDKCAYTYKCHALQLDSGIDRASVALSSYVSETG
jgi:hypothetical protein